MYKDNELNNDDSFVNQNITEATIQELVESNTLLDKKVSSIIDNKNQWRQRAISVRSSNWKLEINLIDLEKKYNLLSQAVAKASGNVQTKRDMLQKYKIQDCHHLEDFRKDFDDEVTHFKNLFCGAQNEYQSENLDKDVEKYKAASLFINEKIEKINNKIQDISDKEGLSEHKLNDDPEILININNAINMMFDNEDALSKIIKFNDNTCTKLKREINNIEREIQIESKK